MTITAINSLSFKSSNYNNIKNEQDFNDEQNKSFIKKYDVALAIAATAATAAVVGGLIYKNKVGSIEQQSKKAQQELDTIKKIADENPDAWNTYKKAFGTKNEMIQDYERIKKIVEENPEIKKLKPGESTKIKNTTYLMNDGSLEEFDGKVRTIISLDKKEITKSKDGITNCIVLNKDNEIIQVATFNSENKALMYGDIFEQYMA